MAKQVINVGTTTNDRTGDSIRLAFQKVNANFTEVYNALNNEPSRRDIVGSIFADDSTLLVDATLGRIVGPIYSSTAEIGNIEISGNTIATTDSSAITIDQVVNLGSDVNVGGDLLPNVANGGNLGSSAKPWGSLYVSNNTIYIGGQAISINDQGELTYNGNRVAHENGEFMTLDNLSDLNVNSPNAGDTIAWAGYQWVNVPLTQDRLADDGDEVVLVGGANPYVTFPAITGGDQLIIQGAEVSSVSGSLALTSQDNLNIIANGSGAAPGGSKNWTFSADGSLTIPGDIRSDSNINIEINLADSTLRRWQFGEDGNLEAPGIVSAAGLRTSETKIALGSNAGQTSQGSSSVAVGAFAGQTSQGPLSVAIGYGAGATTQGTSSVAVGNLAGSTTQGGLSVAVGSGAGQVNQGYEAVAVGFTTGLQDQGTWSVAIGSYAGAFSQGEDAIAIGRFAGQTDQPDNTIILNASGSAVDGVAAQTNSFYVAPIRNIGGTSGVLQYNAATKEVSYSSDITSEGNINIDINLADSTLRRWQFGEDGNLTFPDGTNYSGSTITLPQTTNGIPNKVSWNFSDIMVGSTTTSLEWNLLSTTFSDFIIGTSSAATPFYFNFDGSGQTLGTIDNGGTFGGGKVIFGSTAGNNAGDANAIELKATNGDVYLTSTESVKITVDAADSSARVWTFDPSGNLEAPGIVNAAGLRTSETKIALGSLAGETNQGVNGIAIGALAGYTNQGVQSVAIGANSGNSDQGLQAVALGNLAGALNQGQRAVAIGSLAGSNGQGEYAVALGNFAGGTNQPANSIMINASGSALNGTEAGLYIDPVRNASGTGNILQYNTSTKEITYSSNLELTGDIRSEGNINIDINLSDSTLRRWQFGEDGELTLPEDAVIKTMSGNLTIEGESYVIIDSATNGQIDIGRSSGVGAVSLGNKSNGTNVVVDDLFVASGVYEFFSSLADATGVVTHNCANGHLFYHTSPDTNWTVNLTNLLDTWNRATSVTIIIAQGATGYYPSAVQIAGVAQTINWQGNVTPTPSTNRTDVVRFSIINNSGTYIVLGQLTGF